MVGWGKNVRGYFPVLGLVLLCLSCGDESAEIRQPSDARGSTAAAFDIGEIRERAERSYRFEGAAFRGGGHTYTVSSRGGSFAISGHHFDVGLAMQGRIEASAATVETRSIRRTNELNIPGHSRVADDGHLVIARGPADEHIRNFDTHLEQSWTFDATPTGEGDLVVEVSVSGLEFRQTSASGLHFEDPVSGLGLRYGHATWIDADGQKEHLPARWTGEIISIRVPAEVVDSSSYPAILDPVLSPQVAVDQPVWVPSEAQDLRHRIAYNGVDYLVAWNSFYQGGGEMLATLVDSTGDVKTPGGFVIEYGPGAAGITGVASDGTDFLVSWQDSSSTSGKAEVFASRIDATGSNLDPGGFQITGDACDNWLSALGYDGTNYLVVYPECTPQDRLSAKRVSSAGVVLDSTPIRVEDASANDVWTVVVESNGNGSLVFWMTSAFDLLAARVTPAGAVLDDPPILVAGAARTPQVAFDSGAYLATFHNASTDEIRGKRIASDGTLLDSASFSIGNGYGPDVIGAGGEWLVTWRDVAGIHVRSVSAAGVPSANTIKLSDDRAQVTHISPGTGSQHFVVWGDEYGATGRPNADIKGVRIDNALQPVGTPQVLTLAENRQTRPAIAYDGTNFLVVWVDRRNGHESSDIWGARIDASGAMLDPTGIEIASRTSSERSPDVAFDGTNFVVVWNDAGADNDLTDDLIRGARVDSGGVVLDPVGFDVTASTRSSPQIVSAGGQSFVGWGGDKITRVSNQGVSSNPSGTSTPVAAEGIHLASSGDEIFAVWTPIGPYRVEGSLVTAGGSFGAVTEMGSQNGGKVVFDGENFVVGFRDFVPSLDPGFGIRRFRPGGTPVDAARIPVSHWEPNWDFVSDGRLTLLLTHDGTVGPNGGMLVEARRVNRNGRILDTTPIDLGDAPSGIRSLDLAAIEPGRMMVVRESTTTSHVSRIKSQVLAFNIPPIASSATISVDEDSSVAVTLDATDHEGAALTYAIVTSPASGTLTGTPPALVYEPDSNFNGSDSFTFVADDGEDQSDEGTVVVNVAPVNDAPTVSETEFVVTQDLAFMREFRVEDVDGDAVTVSAMNVPAWLTVDTGPASGTISGTATNDEVGVHEFELVMDDGREVVRETMRVTVENVNDAPEFTSEPPVTVRQNRAYEYPVEAIDADGDDITLGAAELPAWLRFEDAAGGSATLRGTPTGADVGEHSVTLRAADADSVTLQRFTITVTEFNGPPVWVSPTPQEGTLFEVLEGETLRIEFRARDIENRVEYMGVTMPDGARLDVLVGDFTWTPTLDDVGESEVTIEAFDGDFSIDRTVRVQVDFIDVDRDGFPDTAEPAEGLDPTSADTDRDGVPDGADVCPRVWNPWQVDLDDDGVGFECDRDEEPPIASVDDGGCGCTSSTPSNPPFELLIVVAFLVTTRLRFTRFFAPNSLSHQ